MTQRANLNRVRTELEPAIGDFYARMGLNREFHAQDLRDHVTAFTGQIFAPASAQRILQLMRRDAVFDYEVVSRRQSLYRFVPNGTTEFFGLNYDDTGRQSQSESEPCAA